MIFFPELKVFENSGFTISNFIADKESAEYNACAFNINAIKIVYRQAKITPTKNGQFVTVWKRISNGPIQPFDDNDAIDVVVVRVDKDAQSGCFIFPRALLCKQKIVTSNGVEGKRAFRVYPPWDIAQSRQAAATQKWQLDCFVEIKDGVFANTEKLNSLLKAET